MEIRNHLDKYYNRKVTDRQILNIIKSLGRIITKEKHPSNHRKTLYRINPKFIEDITLTIIKLDVKNKLINSYDGILFSPLMLDEKIKFLVIDNRNLT